MIELVSFKNTRTKDKSCNESLNHFAFEIENLEKHNQILIDANMERERIRIDKLTSKKYTSSNDADNIPIQLYE